MDPTIEFKYFAAVLVLLAGIAGTAFARQLSSWKSSVIVNRLANTFAGGVFLGAALIHMIPDAREKLESVFQKMEYPHFALIAGMAFLVVLALDKVISFPHISHTTRGADASESYPYVLALLLSFHSVITGIALGFEQHIVGAVTILVAVLAHKSIAAMALGISLDREKVEMHRARALRWIFYSTTPSGIVIGTLWSSQLEGLTANLVEGIFDAVAGGSFLYIAVVDILIEEFHGIHLGRLFASAVFGFSVMAVLALWA